MQWDASQNAGFSNGKPWLPLHPNYIQRNVIVQAGADSSLLNFYRKMIALRRETPALVRGDFMPVENANKKVLAYKRSYEGKEVLVCLNFSGQTQTITLPEKRDLKVLFSSDTRESGEKQAGKVVLIRR